MNVTGLANSSRGVPTLIERSHAVAMKSERIVPVSKSVAVLVCLWALASPVVSQGWVNVPWAGSRPTFSPNEKANLVFDPVQQDMLLLTEGNRWRWDGQAWSQQANLVIDDGLGGNFSYGVNSAVVRDEVRGTFVFAFGQTIGGPSAGLAEWDGQSSAATYLGPLPGLTPAASDFVRGFKMCYDVSGDRIVAVDASANNVVFRRPFEFDRSNGSWLSLTSNGIYPPMRSLSGGYSQGFQLFYDHSTARVTVVGQDVSLPFYWDLDGATWYQHYPSFAAEFMALSSLSANQPFDRTRVVSMPHLNESWWVDVRPGAPTPYLWSISNRVITQRFLTSWPSQRRDMALGYDSQRDRVVLHGGYSGQIGLLDTWELDPGPSATYTVYGSGCSSSAILPSVSAQNGTLPSVNTQFSVQVSGLPFTAPSFMWVGFSNQSYSGYPLPLDLGFLGAPGCEVLITPDLLYPIPNILGTGVWTLGIPNVPGTVFYNQTVSLDASANSLGLIFSNAGEAVVGQ